MCLQPREHGTAKPAVPCPARELYSYCERGFHPVRALLGLRGHGKGRRLLLQRVQLFPDEAELRVGEARGDASDVAQLALLIGDADQQRAEEWTRAAGLGPAAND